MNPSDVILLGMKKKVAAVERATGRILWEKKLRGGQGDFVTLLCERGLVFACAGGHLHCLELATGAELWQNELSGYGYGLASLCVPDGPSAPSAAALASFAKQQAAVAASAGAAAT